MAQVKEHTQEFKQTLTRLTLRNDSVFFTAMLYSLRHERHDPLVIRGERAPACTDGASICYDGELYGKYTLDDRQFILVHEIMHVVLMHSLRRGAREPGLWNIACDYVVNGMMVDSGTFKTPKEVIQPDPAFKGMNAERVYDLLQKEAQQALAGGKQSGKGQNGRTWVRGKPGKDGQPGQGQGLDGPGQNPNDVKDYQPGGNENKPASQVEREIGVATEKAMASAKAAGQGAHIMKELLREAQVSHEPWYSHLRRYMTTMNEKHYNWAHIHRRRAVLYDLVSPDMRSESMGKLVISIDESGSLTNEQLSAIGAHCAQIFREARPKQVVVLRHTDVVTHEEVHEGPDYSDFQLIRKSTGGTDFRPTFGHIAEAHGDAQVVLMFTDMYGPFPGSPPAIDALWITSTDEKEVATPFGERIMADFND
jgi:predicted metal-dependent peptidase